MAFFKVMFAEGQTCIWACMKFDRLFQLSAALKHKTAPWCRLLSAVLFCLPDITRVEVRCTWAGWVYKSARPDLLPLLLILCFCLFNMHTIIQTADRHVIVHIRYLKSGPWEKWKMFKKYDKFCKNNSLQFSLLLFQDEINLKSTTIHVTEEFRWWRVYNCKISQSRMHWVEYLAKPGGGSNAPGAANLC